MVNRRFCNIWCSNIFFSRVTGDESLLDHMQAVISTLTDARSIEQVIEQLLFEPMTRELLSGQPSAQAKMFWRDDRVEIDSVD